MGGAVNVYSTPPRKIRGRQGLDRTYVLFNDRAMEWCQSSF